VENVKRFVKPRGGNLIKDRGMEIFIGFIFFIIGSLLLYDAFNGRGKPLPWPTNKLAPW
jgi:hypothetical protein